MATNWTSRFAEACAAFFRSPMGDADARQVDGELDVLRVRFREHG